MKPNQHRLSFRHMQTDGIGETVPRNRCRCAFSQHAVGRQALPPTSIERHPLHVPVYIATRLGMLWVLTAGPAALHQTRPRSSVQNSIVYGFLFVTFLFRGTLTQRQTKQSANTAEKRISQAPPAISTSFSPCFLSASKSTCKPIAAIDVPIKRFVGCTNCFVIASTRLRVESGKNSATVTSNPVIRKPVTYQGTTLDLPTGAPGRAECCIILGRIATTGARKTTRNNFVTIPV